MHPMRVEHLVARQTKNLNVGEWLAYSIRTIARLYPRTLEQEANALRRFALPLAKGVHQLLKSSGALDLEEDFIVVVRHLDVQMLSLLRFLGLAGCWWR